MITYLNNHSYQYDSDRGIYSLRLNPCTADITRYLFDPKLPYVWLRQHRPNRFLEWWKTNIPLNYDQPQHLLRVRSMVFDAEIETHQFFQIVTELEDHGIEAYQSNRVIPNTLTLDNIVSQQRLPILRANGIKAGFLLPHKDESAHFWTFEEQMMINAICQLRVKETAILW